MLRVRLIYWMAFSLSKGRNNRRCDEKNRDQRFTLEHRISLAFIPSWLRRINSTPLQQILFRRFFVPELAMSGSDRVHRVVFRNAQMNWVDQDGFVACVARMTAAMRARSSSSCIPDGSFHE